MKRIPPKKSSLSAKDQARLDHLIELPIVAKMNQANDGQHLPQQQPNQVPQSALTFLDSS
jgi:hypothetical protein